MRYDVKRWNMVATFVLFIALCMTITYWAMQIFQPAQRPLAEPVVATGDNINLEAAASLFGGHGTKQRSASNYQLKGIVLASDPAQSVAILVENGKPPRAVRAGGEIASNVFVKEVQQQYVLLSEGGALTRIDLPQTKISPIGSGLPLPVSSDTAAVTDASNTTLTLTAQTQAASTPVAASNEKD
jgi:general secretion pathway protein C